MVHRHYPAVYVRPAPRPRLSLYTYAPLAAALVLRLASTPTANLSYLAIAAYALLGRAHAIRALAMSWLFTLLNPGIAPMASAGSVGRYAVIAAAAASVVIHGNVLSKRARWQQFTVSTVLLGLFFVGHSFIVSPMVDVSVLKGVSWMVAMATIVSAWLGLSAPEYQKLSSELFRCLVLVMVASLPFAAMGVGYLTNGTGFQGILNQPQAFGPAMALLASWAIARLLGESNPSWNLLGIAGCAVLCVFMSEARTGGLALAVGLSLAVIIVPMAAGNRIARVVPGLKSAKVWTIIVLSALAGLILAPKIADVVQHYMTKSGRAAGASLSELYDTSRGRLIQPMLGNIAKYPVQGIGFGIASEPALMKVERDQVLGLPVGASIEKGVAPLAILEEVGMIGALFVTLWIVPLVRQSSRGGLAPLSVCLTVLALNMGEANLFSPGGFGLLPMIILGWAHSSGNARILDQS